MIGDWNAPPSTDAWKPFRALENAGKALFTSVNDEGEFSHLMYRSKTKWGSRLDLTAVSLASAAQISQAPSVVRWKSLDDLLTANPSAKQLKTYIKEIRETVSDHLPVVRRSALLLQCLSVFGLRTQWCSASPDLRANNKDVTAPAATQAMNIVSRKPEVGAALRR